MAAQLEDSLIAGAADDLAAVVSSRVMAALDAREGQLLELTTQLAVRTHALQRLAHARPWQRKQVLRELRASGLL
jgi:hypothetical protein